ncbi:MAG: hypothetical protein K8T91_07565 [Planctomycetes bacterium]|nr:hypothetical protein [Planctomycetota bacterium]
MQLLYDRNDLPDAVKLKDQRFEWLRQLGALELHDANPDDEGFLFGYNHGVESYRKLTAQWPNVRDPPDEREILLRLDLLLDELGRQHIEVPTPRTWVLRIDEELPADLEFPLFVRTPVSSWKRGGDQSKVRNLKELNDEVDLLRRAFGWDTTILARQWLNIAVAGKWMFGNAPQEIRVWIVDKTPIAWSFHYLHAVTHPKGFPPSKDDLQLLARLAAQVAIPFSTRLMVADFVPDKQGRWHFLEAGPGAVAGTAHEAVFKFVAKRVRGETAALSEDAVGGAIQNAI